MSNVSFTITRKHNRVDGIFSELTDSKGRLVAQTLEHSYDLKPKLQPGAYVCKRGPHRLHGMKTDFETFEVTGVPGHTGILFHWGNYNEDSEGCILLGMSYAIGGNGTAMVTASRASFAHFMDSLLGVNEFTLTVKALQT